MGIQFVPIPVHVIFNANISIFDLPSDIPAVYHQKFCISLPFGYAEKNDSD